MNQHEFHEECHVIARMEAVPDGKKQKCRNVTYVSIVEEFETFVHVLENPQVCLYIECWNVIAKAVCVFEDA